MNLFKNKKILIGVGIVVVMLLGYQMFFSGDGDNDTSVLIDNGDAQTETERDILKLLSNLRSIHLNRDFLDTQAFVNLEDYSVFIEEGPTGRRNPFEPIEESGEGEPATE